MKDLLIIIVPQEFLEANHKHLWVTLSSQLNNKMEVLILDIPADLVVTNIKRKYFRFRDYYKGVDKTNDTFKVYRPLTLLRPEVSGLYINKINSLILSIQLEGKIDNFKKRQKHFLYYDGIWTSIINNIDANAVHLYYILDELKLYAHSAHTNRKKEKYDKIACEKANFIFSMTNSIANERSLYIDKISVIGNGAISPEYNEQRKKIPNSIGFIGRFRNWIDLDLLKELVEKRPDLNFCFAGPIEEDVSEYFYKMIDSYPNTMYLGNLGKEIVYKLYQILDIVIVPYKSNDFIKSTRPIKIVEAIFCGASVVTIPMDGYEENTFIRFAKDFSEFSREIDFLLKNPIDKNCCEYQSFIVENSWERKGKQIIDLIT